MPADGRTGPQILVLNGGSSSGKTSVARELQEVMDGVWLRLGVDTLIEALPASFFTGSALTFAPDGEVLVGNGFQQVEDWWMAGVARMAEAGAQILIEDNFVSGPGGQHRWQAALAGLRWAGWECAATQPSQPNGNTLVAIGSPGWRPSRRTQCTRASPTTWRSTPAERHRPRSRLTSGATSSVDPATARELRAPAPTGALSLQKRSSDGLLSSGRISLPTIVEAASRARCHVLAVVRRGPTNSSPQPFRSEASEPGRVPPRHPRQRTPVAQQAGTGRSASSCTPPTWWRRGRHRPAGNDFR
ncbi:hypothetical protein KIH74_06670 [Kineosporia sp. J2-2]|uniref:Chloramphenicol 3-O phosphotransferase n=1 Tax=Kineosporia corallincola TaxID=2835133 RepID=A0ABS5TBZ6_9ACTN|nr:hypothetical protein [Kineosporia corallincola]